MTTYTNKELINMERTLESVVDGLAGVLDEKKLLTLRYVVGMVREARHYAQCNTVMEVETEYLLESSEWRRTKTRTFIVTPVSADDTGATRYHVRNVNTGETAEVGYAYGAQDPRKAAICDAFAIDPQDYPNGIQESGHVSTWGEDAYKTIYTITK